MERLTKTYGDGSFGVANKLPCGENSYAFKSLLIEKLGAYEDLEEQGRLLKLPCKAGDTVYIVEDDCEGDPACCYHTCDSCNQRNPHIEKTKFYVEDIEGLGEYIFLTKEEAEAKLKELRGGENE